MSEEIQEQETEIQNENTQQEQTVENEQQIDTQFETQENTEQPSDEEETPSKEELDALSDEEFEEFLNTGNLPAKAKQQETQKQETTPKPKEQSNTQQQNTTQNINYEEVYKTLFKPFKANGKEITPRTVDDIISLMQMGANYTKKMQLMAPMKRAVESLNKASIKEDDLNFLIDLHKGDKEAIKNLLKKHNIDPMDLDLDEVNYAPNKKNIASEEDVEFSDTLLDINDSLPKIQEIVNNVWDKKSKNLLLNDPNLMKALHEEIQMGRFDKVQKKVEEEKTFGRYKGVSDVEAYIDVVTKMVNSEQQNKSSTPKPTDTQPKTTPSKPIPDKSKAAPTKGTKAKGSSLTAKDLFSMSEEEFSKLSIKDLV